MKEVSVRGTLGDTYVAACKIKNIKDVVHVFHHTQHTYWRGLISEIYSLLDNANITFVDSPRLDLEEITSNVHEQGMNFFPRWEVRGHFSVIKPYIVIQPHSGKPVGGNEKQLPKFFLQSMLSTSAYPCVLLGTNKKYECVTNCINLIGKTTIIDSIQIIRNAEKFIGPEGLLSFVASSHKVKSTVYYSSHEAVEKRILNSPWDKYCELVNINTILDVV